MNKVLAFFVLLIVFSMCVGKEEKVGKEAETIKVSSPAFKNMERIPIKYTCDGIDVSPPLEVQGISEKAKSIAIIVEDPDAPLGTFVHWVVWNIEPKKEIPENYKSEYQGKNDFGRIGYNGPCPPRGEMHRYFFKVYVLDEKIELKKGATKEELLKAIEGHVIQKGELIGVYSR